MGIQVQDGSWVDQLGDIGKCFIWYYTELFTTSNPPRVQEAIQNIPPMVTESMNADLVGP